MLPDGVTRIQLDDAVHAPSGVQSALAGPSTDRYEETQRKQRLRDELAAEAEEVRLEMRQMGGRLARIAQSTGAANDTTHLSASASSVAGSATTDGLSGDWRLYQDAGRSSSLGRFSSSNEDALPVNSEVERPWTLFGWLFTPSSSPAVLEDTVMSPTSPPAQRQQSLRVERSTSRRYARLSRREGAEEGEG